MADSADETIKFREKPDIGTTMAEAAETSAIVMPDASKQPLMQQPLILSETNVATKMDDFYQLGKYTYIVCALAELLILCQVGNMLFMLFAGAAPLVSCDNFPNETSETICRMLDNETNTTPCNGLKLTSQFYSVNTEFQYYCSSGKIVKQTISYQMIGVIVGASIFGYASDKWGRRNVITIGLIPCMVCMVISTFTSSLFWFTFWRFFVNVFNGGTMAVLAVFTSEHYPKRHRFFITNIIWWSPNFVIFGLLAWFTGEWRMLSRVSAALALPCLIILYALNESAIWLVGKGRFEEAKNAIIRMHRIDGRECDEALIEGVISREKDRFNNLKQRQNYHFLHLFYTAAYARYTISIAFSFFIASLINYSLLFNMEKLSGSIYLNTILMGAFRYSINLAIAFLDKGVKAFGRKLAHLIADALCAIALAIYVLVYLFGLDSSLGFMMRAAVLGTIGFCSIFYTTNGLVANELFPSGIRNLSYSFGQILTRIGVVCAPQIYFLADYWLPLPHFVMCILAIVDLVLFQANIIETKGRPLPEHFPAKEQCILYSSRTKTVELLPCHDPEAGQEGSKEEPKDITAVDADKAASEGNV